MVDFFGKKRLEERIIELEEAIAVQEREREELVRTLEKRDEKIKRLTSANQEANIALKALERKAAAQIASTAQITEQVGEKPGLPDAMEAVHERAEYPHSEAQRIPFTQGGSAGCMLSLIRTRKLRPPGENQKCGEYG